MVKNELGFGDYLKEAFRRRARVPVLGAMPLNYLFLGAAGVLGLANPGFWLLGIALEISYLFGKSTSRRFQKLVQGERLLAAKKTWEEQVQEAVDQLEPSSRELCVSAIRDEGLDRWCNYLESCRERIIRQANP